MNRWALIGLVVAVGGVGQRGAGCAAVGVDLAAVGVGDLFHNRQRLPAGITAQARARIR